LGRNIPAVPTALIMAHLENWTDGFVNSSKRCQNIWGCTGQFEGFFTVLHKRSKIVDCGAAVVWWLGSLTSEWSAGPRF
jgi:hypothetical protein